MNQQMRTWAEIDLDRLAHNYHALRSLTHPSCGFVGVVKANAYGHGAIPVAKKLEELGATLLAVACLAEAVALREGGITAPILILGITDSAYLSDLITHQLIQAVGDLEQAKAFSQGALALGQQLTVHVKVDTGMSRLGFLADEARSTQAVAEISTLCGLEGLAVQGIFTHFSDADGSESYTTMQLNGFLSVVDQLEEKGHQFTYRHCAASAATLTRTDTHLDLIRPGIALYGHTPDPGLSFSCPLESVLTFKSAVATVRNLPAGTAVSYGRTHVLTRDSRVAVLPVGYGDGFARRLSGGYQVSIRGHLVPILGRICMDLTMVDVTDVPEIVAGDVATLYGDDCPIEVAAQRVGTISYELLCDLTPRIPRIYHGQEID